jgi:hypothetical protein
MTKIDDMFLLVMNQTGWDAKKTGEWFATKSELFDGVTPTKFCHENNHMMSGRVYSFLNKYKLEKIREPMIWDGEGTVGNDYEWQLNICVPEKFCGKRVKVRIEEILE